MSTVLNEYMMMRVVSGIFVPKTIKIWSSFFKLQLIMSGSFFWDAVYIQQILTLTRISPRGSVMNSGNAMTAAWASSLM